MNVTNDRGRSCPLHEHWLQISNRALYENTGEYAWLYICLLAFYFCMPCLHLCLFLGSGLFRLGMVWGVDFLIPKLGSLGTVIQMLVFQSYVVSSPSST
ncbi:hypothetical protein V8F20_000248 [Naviculisporaceae sp. PSN 640]